MIFLIGGQKGGTGKSTIATNLAVALTLAGREVVLVDTDRQLTASNWADRRENDDDQVPSITCMERHGKIFKTLRDLEQRYQVVIVDSGGHDSIEFRTALGAADAIYSPVRASQSDLWTLDALSELVEQARAFNPALRAHLILSMTPTNPQINERRSAVQLLGNYPAFVPCSSFLSDRKVFRDAMSRGRGVLELDDAKAKVEMEALTLEVMEHAGVTPPPVEPPAIAAPLYN